MLSPRIIKQKKKIKNRKATHAFRTSVAAVCILESKVGKPELARKSALARNFCWSSLSMRSASSCMKGIKTVFRKEDRLGERVLNKIYAAKI